MERESKNLKNERYVIDGNGPHWTSNRIILDTPSDLTVRIICDISDGIETEFWRFFIQQIFTIDGAANSLSIVSSTEFKYVLKRIVFDSTSVSFVPRNGEEIKVKYTDDRLDHAMFLVTIKEKTIIFFKNLTDFSVFNGEDLIHTDKPSMVVSLL